MNKAISEIIIAVFIVFIAISLTSVIYLFITGFSSDTTAEISKEGSSTFKKIGSCIEVVSFDDKTNNLWLKNCGRHDLKDIKLMVDNVPQTYGLDEIKVGEIKGISVSAGIGEHEVKVLSDYASATNKIEFTNWFDSGAYRRSIDITGSSSDLTDYQVNVTILYDSDMRSDYGDLMFYNTFGNSLNYWIEDYTVMNAIVWVKVPSISTTGTTVYMFYGNPSASSASDGDATFDFFDDFGNADKWTISNTNVINIIDGKLKVHAIDDTVADAYVTNKPMLGNNYVLYFEHAKKQQPEDYNKKALQFGVSSGQNCYVSDNKIVFMSMAYPPYATYMDIRTAVDGQWYGGTTMRDPTLDETYSIQIKKSGASVHYKLWDTSHSESNPNDEGYLSAKNNDYEFAYISCGTDNSGGIESEFDNLRIRKYALPEPTISIGAEETK